MSHLHVQGCLACGTLLVCPRHRGNPPSIHDLSTAWEVGVRYADGVTLREGLFAVASDAYAEANSYKGTDEVLGTTVVEVDL
jgi:hypothetical protein